MVREAAEAHRVEAEDQETLEREVDQVLTFTAGLPMDGLGTRETPAIVMDQVIPPFRHNPVTILGQLAT